MTLLSRFNYYVDRYCSVFVVGAVALVNLYTLQYFPSTVVVPFLTSCTCVAAALSKGLKRVVNQSRPAGAPKLSPGMPSNHATSLAFLCVVTVYGLQRYASAGELSSSTGIGGTGQSFIATPPLPALPRSYVPPLQCLAVFYSLYATALRVVQGHHTVAQVAVGYAFGVCCASLCLVGNYYGYTRVHCGGRVDDMSALAKVAVTAGSVGISLLAMRAIVRGARAPHGKLAKNAAPQSPATASR